MFGIKVGDFGVEHGVDEGIYIAGEDNKDDIFNDIFRFTNVAGEISTVGKT